MLGSFGAKTSGSGAGVRFGRPSSASIGSGVASPGVSVGTTSASLASVFGSAGVGSCDSGDTNAAGVSQQLVLIGLPQASIGTRQQTTRGTVHVYVIGTRFSTQRCTWIVFWNGSIRQTRYGTFSTRGSQTMRQVVTVHKDAIIKRGGGSVVYVVTDDKAQPRRIQIGEAAGPRVEVLDGLSVGENVVVRGNERLRPGAPVTIRKGS